MASVPQTTLTWLWNVLSRNQYDPNQSYRDPNRTYHDVVRVLAQYPSFGPRTDVYTYENGYSTLLLHLVGTLPVTFRGTLYNFPLDIWIPHAYPFDPPIVYVTPTSDMVVRVGQHVTLEGKVYHHYLAHWAEAWDRSSIIDLLTVLRDVFSKEPPVKYKPQSTQTLRTQPTRPAQPTPPPVPPLPAELASTPVSPPQQRPQQQQQRQEAPPQPPELPPKPGQQSPQSSRREVIAANAPTPVSAPPAPPLPPKGGDGGRQSYHYHANGSVDRTQVLQGPTVQQQAPSYRHDQYQSQHARHASMQYSAPVQYAAGHAPQPGQDPRFHYHQHVQPPYPSSPHSPPAGVQHIQRTQPGPPPPPPPPPHLHPHPPQTAAAAAPSPPATTQAQPPKQETPDLLTSPFELELPAISTEPPPPVPPNPEKDALLQALSQTLTETLQANIAQSRSAQGPLQSQAQALHRAMATLQNEINSLTDFQKTLQSNITVLQQSLHRADAVIADARSRISNNNPPPSSTAPSSPTTTASASAPAGGQQTAGLPPIDEVLVPPTVVGKQLYDLVAEERGIEQAIYALQTALAKGVITTETWSKHTRSLAREAFMKKALIRKIGKGMGLE